MEALDLIKSRISRLDDDISGCVKELGLLSDDDSRKGLIYKNILEDLLINFLNDRAEMYKIYNSVVEIEFELNRNGIFIT